MNLLLKILIYAVSILLRVVIHISVITRLIVLLIRHKGNIDAIQAQLDEELIDIRKKRWQARLAEGGKRD